MIQVIETNQTLNLETLFRADLRYYKFDDILKNTFNTPFALFIQKLHCFSKRPSGGIKHEGKHWIFNTREQWASILNTSVRSVSRFISIGKKSGIVETCKPFGQNGCNAYRLNYNTLLKILNSSKEVLNSIKNEFKNLLEKLQNRKKKCKNIENENLGKQPISSDWASQFGRSYIHKSLNKSYKSEASTQNEKFHTKKKEDKSPKEKIYPCEEMLNYWNEGLGKALEVHERLNTTTAKQLNAFLKHKLSGNVELWKRYCDSFFDKPYMMKGHPESGWKISLLWMLKFSSWDKHGGEVRSLHEREKEKENNAEQCVAAVVDHIQEVETTNGEEADLRKQVIESVGETSYSAWMKGVDIRIDGDVIHVICPSTFIRDALENKSFANIPDLDRIWSEYTVRTCLVDDFVYEEVSCHNDLSGYPKETSGHEETISENALNPDSDFIDEKESVSKIVEKPSFYNSCKLEDYPLETVSKEIHSEKNEENSDMSYDEDHQEGSPKAKTAWYKIFSFMMMFLVMSFVNIEAKESSPIMTYKVHGPSDAKFQLLVFSSPSCDNCKIYHEETIPQIKSLLKSNEEASDLFKIVLVPYFSDAFGWEVLKACSVKGDGNFLLMYKHFMKTQDQWMPVVFEQNESAWEEFQRTIASHIHHVFPDKSISFWLQSLQSSPDEKWLNHHKVVTDKYLIDAIPMVLLCDANGDVVHKFPSPPTPQDIAKIIIQLMHRICG